jgi:hypothetical protein
MVSCCAAQKSFNSSISDTSIDLCQHCLLNYLPFQSLHDLDYEFTVSNEINISEEEMDGLMHLKFNLNWAECFHTISSFPNFTSVDITVYQHGKNVLYLFYNIAQRNIKKEIFRRFRVDIELYQSAFCI